MNLDDFLSNVWSGTEAEFARLVSDSGEVRARQQHINKIRRGRAKASPALAMRIEVVSKGKVTRRDLRPDIWPNPPRKRATNTVRAFPEKQVVG